MLCDARVQDERRRKVIFLVPTYAAESVSFVAYQYVTAMRRRGIDARICSLRRSEMPHDELVCRSKWELLGCDTLVTNLLLPDLLGFVLSRLLPWIRWRPFLHCHIIGGLAAERKPFARAKAWVWRAILSTAPVLAAPSRYALRSVPNARRTAVIPHCIEPAIEAAFRSLARSGTAAATATDDATPAPCADTDTLSYVFIGRDTRAKRLRSLLGLLQTNPMINIKVIGALDHSRRMFDALPASQAARCQILGQQFDPYAYVLTGDIVVCPSGREGFGLVPIECLARDIPVAVIDEGAFKELYGGMSIVYDRVANLPRSAAKLTRDNAAIRERFIGASVLDQRVDLLWAIL